MWGHRPQVFRVADFDELFNSAGGRFDGNDEPILSYVSSRSDALDGCGSDA